VRRELSVRHLVLGTAGHIDHGKSALVRALTGTDPDRLKEEKLRGITIDLGFADLDLGEGKVLSLVDVPGHERFVRHMVAGATGIDAVLLVVAADEGIRPQTREHLAICSLLDVRHGVLALTKADLVDHELLEVVLLEVQEFLAGTFLAGSRIVAVSSRTGEGLDALRGALLALFSEVAERPVGGVPRLPVDRSFVLKGFGTVVTGTLASGALREGDEVEVLPSKLRGRIRGLQVHHHRVAEARAGQRTAANLQGIDHAEVERGATVTIPNALLTTRRIWARVRILPQAAGRLGRGGAVSFHQGTCERSARMIVMRDAGGGQHDVEILLGRETVLLPGDRFILRRPAPMDTVGGGTVLEIRPPAARGRGRRIAPLAAADAKDRLLVLLGRAGAGGRDRASLASELGLGATDLDTLADGLRGQGRVVAAAGVLLDATVWLGVENEVLRTLSSFHAAEPLRLGCPREDLRARSGRMSLEVFRALLQDMETRGKVRLMGEKVALADHRVVLSERDRELYRRLEARFRQAGLDPPDAGDLTRESGIGRGEQILDVLVAEGVLIRIKDGRLFHAAALDELRRRLREYGRKSRRIDVAAFKELAGVTRKNAIPLLEQMDAERVTRRLGNEREILDGEAARDAAGANDVR
jgi:selenocysteine-specific elongation factor